MKDYTYLKLQIWSIPLRKENELDALLKDQELMSTIDRMCRKSNADLPLYIQFLMEKAGDHNLRDFARIIVEYGRKTRPEMC